MLDFLAPYWNFLLVHPLISLLVGAYDLLHDFGFAIVFITIVIRLALYPLFRIQIQNQRAMQELAPAMSELKAKYGSDKQRLGQEQMKLYQERGYNPAMGCLPILLQMPLLLAMYQAFIQAPHLTGQTLGPDLLPDRPGHARSPRPAGRLQRPRMVHDVAGHGTLRGVVPRRDDVLHHARTRLVPAPLHPVAHLTRDGSPTGLAARGPSVTIRAWLQNFRC